MIVTWKIMYTLYTPYNAPVTRIRKWRLHVRFYWENNIQFIKILKKKSLEGKYENEKYWNLAMCHVGTSMSVHNVETTIGNLILRMLYIEWHIWPWNTVYMRVFCEGILDIENIIGFFPIQRAHMNPML